MSIPKKPINVVFDLDCTLVQVIDRSYRDKEFEELYKTGYVSKNDIIYACKYPHYIYPGCREFLQYVATLTQDQLIFFSNGAPERNNELVPKLLKNAFESKDATNTIEKAKVYSRSDEVDTTILPDNGNKKYQPDPHYYMGMYGQMKKDLQVIFPENQLDMTVIIEDDPSYITKGQEKSLLLVSGQNIRLDILTEYVAPSKETIEDFTLPDIITSDSFIILNKLIYGAGVLSKAYEEYQSSDRPFTEILWSMQFVYSDGYSPDNYHNRPDWWGGQKKAEFYQQGLKILRQFNDQLNFFMGRLWMGCYY